MVRWFFSVQFCVTLSFCSSHFYSYISRWIKKLAPWRAYDCRAKNKNESSAAWIATMAKMMTIKTDIRIISAPINYVVNLWKAPRSLHTHTLTKLMATRTTMKWVNGSSTFLFGSLIKTHAQPSDCVYVCKSVWKSNTHIDNGISKIWGWKKQQRGNKNTTKKEAAETKKE